MSVFNLGKPDRPIEVGVILMNGETEILDVAPVDMLHCFSKKFIETLPEEWVSKDVKAQALNFNFHWVSEHSFETCPPLDVVLIGAHNVGYTPNDAELAFVRKAWNDCSAFLTICAGVEVAVQAGILGGKTATAPRFMMDILRQQAQSINWVEKRWARDGKLWTSGAFLNGIDLLYAFAHTVWGGEGTPVSRMSAIGGWPVRDVDYENDTDGL